MEMLTNRVGEMDRLGAKAAAHVHAAKSESSSVEMTSMIQSWLDAAKKSQDPVYAFYSHNRDRKYRRVNYNSAHIVFSNFYEHAFDFDFDRLPEVALNFAFTNINVDGTRVLVPSSEHAIMLCKAVLFKDYDAFGQIQRAASPADAKKLGRIIHSFNQVVWDLHKESIALQCVLQKFMSDDGLKTTLLGTHETILCEATTGDRIWGIGLDVDDPIIDTVSEWRGLNMLGAALMAARSGLRAQIFGPPVESDIMGAAFDNHMWATT
jgi:ribA/ribD-fused uncharacterized protein